MPRMDIPFVFGIFNRQALRLLPGFVAPAQRLSDRMQDAWAGFARSGEPSHARGPSWDLYEPEHRSSLSLDRECGMVDRPLEAELELMESWL